MEGKQTCSHSWNIQLAGSKAVRQTSCVMNQGHPGKLCVDGDGNQMYTPGRPEIFTSTLLAIGGIGFVATTLVMEQGLLAVVVATFVAGFGGLLAWRQIQTRNVALTKRAGSA